MRGPRPAHRLLFALSVLALTLPACRSNSSESPSPEPAKPSVAEPDTAPAKPGGSAGPSLATPAAPDPERADKLADLDTLCKAVDHDYKDGTLGDYYAGVKMRSAWGQAQLDAGNESIQPGRLLEKAVASLSPNAADPALPNCRTLLDYLDDVE